MNVTRVIAVAVLVAASGIGFAHAQSLSRGDTAPAEFPPSSFSGKQYIDSRGCVFIRAGIDGTVTWVPRVNRSRNLICGQQPTLGGRAVAAAAPAPAAAPPQQITIATPAPKPAVAAPAPRPVTTVAPRSVPAAVVRRVAPPSPVAAAPAPVVAAPAAQPVPVRRAGVVTRPVPSRQAACQGASALSRQYINSGSRLPVRCGPQTESYTSGAGRVVASAGQGTLTGQTRIVPRHVYIDRQNTQRTVVPEGYRLAWEDDRLNPRRAEQTLDGHARMGLIWTSTVPRRLINQVTGADVTAIQPLVYPYTDIATQQRELGRVTIERRQGVLVKRITRNPGTATYRAPTVSSRSAPVAQAAPTPARAAPTATGTSITGKGYVSLGTYRDAGSAQNAAQRAMRMGLPARIGKFDRSGQEMRMVLVGPFPSAATQRGALAKARGAGFGSAQLR